MIHHLILANDAGLDLHVRSGKLISGDKRIALDVLGSVQCFAARARWTQTALESLSGQCPCVMARWDLRAGKWATFSLIRRCRHVNPEALAALCQLPERRSTQLASDVLLTKVGNQHLLLRALDPFMAPLPKLKATSFSRILRAEARFAKTFWPRYFAAASSDLFTREKRRASHPLNVALNYGYGFLYHALEWQCTASGLEPSIGLIHKHRKNRPSLVCDLIEPFRCCVEITLMRHLDRMHEKQEMAARYAAMLEEKWAYRGKRFRLRSIIRLSVESFVKSLLHPAHRFRPFALHAGDACL